MSRLSRYANRLQESQLSVQALTRLANVCVFLLASWTDNGHVALVAFQGALLAIPYTLIEAMVGRPQSAGVVPRDWHVESWALRTAATVTLPVGLVGFLAVSVALPQTGIADRLVVIAPVLLQLPLEALFWALARTRSRRRANLVPQLVAAGTLVTAVGFAATGVRLDAAAIPAQLAVGCWLLATRLPTPPGERRPGPLQGLRVGAAYCLAAAVDLGYAVALPSVAGALAGPAAVVVLRAMDLAFGPFHVALAATTREDIVAGRAGRFRTGARALTVLCLVGISIALLSGPELRGLLATELADTAGTAVALYCAYKAGVMLSTWLATRHMVRAPPRTFLVSAVGSRALSFGALSFGALGAAALGGDLMAGLFLLLAVGEAAVVAWYAVRSRATPAAVTESVPRPRNPAAGAPQRID